MDFPFVDHGVLNSFFFDVSSMTKLNYKLPSRHGLQLAFFLYYVRFDLFFHFAIVLEIQKSFLFSCFAIQCFDPKSIKFQFPSRCGVP
jgi:hypothetical protein